MCVAFKSAEPSFGRAGEERVKHHFTICYFSNTTLPRLLQYDSTANLPKESLLIQYKHSLTVKRWVNKWEVFHSTVSQLMLALASLLFALPVELSFEKNTRRIPSCTEKKVWIFCKRFPVVWLCLYSRPTHRISHLSDFPAVIQCYRFGTGTKISNSAGPYFISRETADP